MKKVTLLPKKTKVDTDAMPSAIDLTKEKNKSITALALITPKLDAVPVIKTQAQYAEVDAIRLSIRKGQTEWAKKTKPAIASLNRTKKLILDIFKEVDKTYQDKLDIADELLKAYIIKQNEKAKLEQAKVDAEAAKLELRAKAKLNLAALATSPKRREALLTEAAEIEVQAKEVAKEVVELPESENSTNIPVVKCKLYSKRDLIQHIAYLEANGGEDLTSLFDLNVAELNAKFKLDNPPVGLGEWLPGVEVYDDLILKSKRGTL